MRTMTIPARRGGQPSECLLCQGYDPFVGGADCGDRRGSVDDAHRLRWGSHNADPSNPATDESRLTTPERKSKGRRLICGQLRRGSQKQGCGWQRSKPASRPGAEVQAVPGNAADKKLEGVWRIVGINGHHQGEFQKPPYDEYKIMTAGHYLWLSFRPETGEVLRSGGGLYTLKDGEYKARIECSNSADLLAPIVGKEYSGRCIIDGDKWYHNGNVPNGAPFDEVWQRVR